VAVDWLRQLFELPDGFGGVLTTGATMANFVSLAAARNWWAERLGVDVERDGVAGPPATDRLERVPASTSKLATDLARFPVLREWTTADLQMLAGLMVDTMIATVGAMFDVAVAAPEAEAEIARVARKSN
jgi:hypothetical protein